MLAAEADWYLALLRVALSEVWVREMQELVASTRGPRVVPPSWIATKNAVHHVAKRELSNETAARVYGFDDGRRTADGKWNTDDEEGRVVSFTSGAREIHYTYDPRGRVVGRRAVNITDDVLPAETTWVWDPLTDRLVAIFEAGRSVIADAAAEPGLVRQYIHGDAGYDDPIEVLLKLPGSATVERYLPPRYLQGAVADRISVEVRKDAEGNVAEAKVRVRLSETVDDNTLESGVRLTAISAGNGSPLPAEDGPTDLGFHQKLEAVLACTMVMTR